MSSMVRSMQREMVRQKCYKRDGNTKAFRAEWQKFHYPRVEATDKNGNVTSKVKRVNQKRKRSHTDNGKVFIRQLRAFKQFVNGLKNADKSDANAVAEAAKN